MSKVTWSVPQRQKAIEDRLRSTYGGMMLIKDVMIEIRLKDYKPANDWLDGIPYAVVNGMKKWLVDDVAKKIYQSIITP